MELEILRWIQSFASPTLDLLMQGCTILGEQLLLAAVFCAVYWCVDKKTGQALLLSVCFSALLNGVVKDSVKAARPIGQEGIVSRRLHTATGHSFPSGHTQTGAAFWLTAGLRSHRKIYLAGGILLPLLIGLSRLYLGVHYPADVLAGLILGGGSALLLSWIMEKGHIRLLLIMAAALSAGILWVRESPDSFKSLGLLLGGLIGLWYEGSRVDFSIEGVSGGRKFLRFFLGLSTLGIIYTLPKVFLPGTALIYVLRYALVGFYAAGGWPALFTRFHW